MTLSWKEDDGERPLVLIFFREKKRMNKKCQWKDHSENIIMMFPCVVDTVELG